MFHTTITIEGHETTYPHHVLTDDESALLDQIIAIDSSDEVILASEDIRNGSGRIVGSHLTIRSEAWDYILASLADYARDAEATDSRQLSTTDDIVGGL